MQYISILHLPCEKDADSSRVVEKAFLKDVVMSSKCV